MIYPTLHAMKQSKRLNRLCRSCASKKQHKKPDRKKIVRTMEMYLRDGYKDKISSKGKNNGMYGKSVYNVWIKKYGKEEADKRLISRNEKLSKASSGKNNPMYGKPSPQGSGNGWSGWYKDIYFRSLLELSFLYELINSNTKFINGECSKYKIEYEMDGQIKNYYPDYIVDNIIYEIKPKRLWNSKNVIFKKNAAERWCAKNNMSYKIIEPIRLNKELIKNLLEEKSLKILDKYAERLNKYINQ